MQGRTSKKRVLTIIIFLSLTITWYRVFSNNNEQGIVLRMPSPTYPKINQIITKEPNISTTIGKPVKTTVSVSKQKRPWNIWCNNCFQWQIPLLKDINDDFCAERNGSSVELLIIAVSRHQNREHRDVLRKIYSHDPDYGNRIRLLFAFGLEASGNKAEDDLLLKEYQTHGDVLIFDRKIHYLNMYFLNFNTFSWATQKCKNARFLVKITDDVFLNIPGWLKTFEKFGSSQLHDVHFGTCNYGTDHPIRNTKHKWGISKEAYPFKNYPGYCAGGGLFLSLETTKELLKELSNLALVLPFDDADIGLSLLLTGHCVCNIPSTYISYGYPHILNRFHGDKPKQCTDFTVNPFLALHMQGRSPQKMLSLWKLKHCLSDRYPKELKCPRRYTCKQPAYPVNRAP